jgi:hypothetical protein
MNVKEKPLRHWINHFFGYGSWNAKIWFITYEEPGGDLPEEVAEKLDYFYSAHQSEEQPVLCDVRELYKHATYRGDRPKSDLYKNLYEYRFGSKAALLGPWKNLIAFEHGYKNKKLPDLLSYQKKFFALPSAAKEALITLYPLPSPHNHAWYYSWLDLPQFDFLKNRIQYQEHVYPSRMRNILNNIREYKPELVLMYGMDNINQLKKSVQEVFPDAKFKMVKAMKLKIPQHHAADLNGTKMVITTQVPVLRHNRIETGFDWEEFGKTVKTGN